MLKSTERKSQEENTKLQIIEEKLKDFNDNIITKDTIKENLNEYKKEILSLEQKINAIKTQQEVNQQAAVAAAKQAATNLESKIAQLKTNTTLDEIRKMLTHADKTTLYVRDDPNIYSLDVLPDLRSTLNLVKTPHTCPAGTWHWEFPGCYKQYIDIFTQNNNLKYLFVEAFYGAELTGGQRNDCILLININNNVYQFRVILGGNYKVGTGRKTEDKTVSADKARVIYNDQEFDIDLKGIDKQKILMCALEILFGELLSNIQTMTTPSQYNENLAKLRDAFPNAFMDQKYNLQNKYLKNDSSLSKYESKYLKYKQKYLQLKKELSL